jgi:hypothetical protein
MPIQQKTLEDNHPGSRLTRLAFRSIKSIKSCIEIDAIVPSICRMNLDDTMFHYYRTIQWNDDVLYSTCTCTSSDIVVLNFLVFLFQIGLYVGRCLISSDVYWAAYSTQLEMTPNAHHTTWNGRMQQQQPQQPQQQQRKLTVKYKYKYKYNDNKAKRIHRTSIAHTYIHTYIHAIVC